MTNRMRRPAQRAFDRSGVLASMLGAVIALTCAGCESAGFRVAKEQSEQRWNAARGKVKAQLASDQLESGNITAAAVELAEAMRANPDDDDLIPLQARVHLAAGELNQAQRALERGYGPDAAPEVDYLLGVVWQQREQWDAALECFERAATKAPREVAYATAYAQTLTQRGRAPEARDWLVNVAHELAYTAAYQATLGEAYEAAGDDRAALTCWRKVAESGERDPRLRQRLALALCKAGETQDAIPLLRELIAEDNPGADALRVKLAECLLVLEEFDAARDVALETLRRRPGDVGAMCVMAHVLTRRGAEREAFDQARRAVALEPDNIAALELATTLALRTGQHEQARAYATRLLALEADHPIARVVLERLRRAQ